MNRSRRAASAGNKR